MLKSRDRFGSFQGSDRRVRLFDRLAELMADLRRSGRFAAVVINGSFATAKAVPEDVDAIIVFPANHDWNADLIPADYALVSRAALRRRFGFDVLLASDAGEDYARYVEFFSRVRDDGPRRKGMLRINL
jgi:hypothetical protein